jgi:hypothetical protein
VRPSQNGFVVDPPLRRLQRAPRAGVRAASSASAPDPRATAMASPQRRARAAAPARHGATRRAASQRAPGTLRDCDEGRGGVRLSPPRALHRRALGDYIGELAASSARLAAQPCLARLDHRTRAVGDP